MKRFSILFLIVLVMGISPAFAENNLDETSRREIESVLEESIFQDKNKEEALNVEDVGGYAEVAFGTGHGLFRNVDSPT